MSDKNERYRQIEADHEAMQASIENSRQMMRSAEHRIASSKGTPETETEPEEA
ncbi:MAG TPA: hypothetical protein VGD10_04130 [Allosphingosinicella sp.]|uniref:hypothetical protein n=1 Tax=Allosphingosinicella sp. TaxID=2823234 RepID=UPI002ED84B78